MQFLTIQKNNKVGLAYIPELSYEQFYEQVLDYLQDPSNQIVSYYGIKKNERISMFCAIANDQTETIYIASYSVADEPGVVLASLSLFHLDAFYFEYQIQKKLGVLFNFPN
ncbi:hypothetical protein [Telluribacter sp. SYSU D00476]|uniref:hypothetical protein n=1 Tax=Telluribacter sp. SYSU D00476 TaxID=2811430 RepID=UPI001FF4B714|nr:hypothetical protein [Telluribacter sp. SYSU D00476]